MSYAALSAFMARSQREDAEAKARGWTKTHRGDTHRDARPFCWLNEKQKARVQEQYPGVDYEQHCWIPPGRTTESGGYITFSGEE